MSNQTATDWSNVEPHLWLGSYDPGGIPEQPFKENALTFADRHDLTLVLSRWNTTEADAEALESQLREAKRRDIDVWLGTYDLRESTDRELLDDDGALEADLERLLRMVGTYADFYPDGNVFVWHEAPLTGRWTGDSSGEKAQSIAEHGGEIFGAQKRAVAEQYPEIDLGLMIHYPFIAPPTHSNRPIFGDLMSDLASRDALPDFTYFDFYRGYHEWDGGYEAVNDFLRSIIENIREHTGDRPVYYLGESHSINNHYTPSKQAMLGNLWTALDAGVDSYGWYIRKGFKRTADRNYEPFVPNVGEYEGPFNSVVGSRDRFVWSTLALLEATDEIDADDRFDLWLYGHDLEFYEYDVHLRGADGEWTFVGSVNGYLDGDHPYSGTDRDRAVVVRALERDRFLTGDEIDVRLDARGRSDGATLAEAHAMPHLDAAHYLTESDATRLVEETPDLAAYSLGSDEAATDLPADSAAEVALSLGEPERSLAELARPDQRSAFERVANLESDGFTPRERFDLWVYGQDLNAVAVTLDGTSIEDYRSSDGGEDAAVYRGLDRSTFFERNTGGHHIEFRADASTDTTVTGVFAMPYHGTANFTTDAEAASVVERDYREGEGQLTTFSLGHQVWVNGADLGADDVLETWIQVPDRRIVAQRNTPQY